MFSQGEQSCGFEIKHSLIEMYVNSTSQLDMMLKKGTIEGSWSQNNRKLTIDVQNLAPGTYIVKISNLQRITNKVLFTKK